MASHPQNDGAPPPLRRRRPPHVLLLLWHPIQFSVLDRPLPDGFRFLKPWESPLPLDDFLSSADARSTEAILASGMTPVTADMLRQLPEVRLAVADSAGLNHIDVGAGRQESRNCWIGPEVAKRLKAFGCSISCNSRKKKPHVLYPFYSDVCELATNCDALVICCGLTEQTHHMINREVLLALGKEGVIVNIGRGPIIDEKEMVQLLVQGKLGGAGLDVLENEPNVPEELLALDNVVLSPQTALFIPGILFGFVQSHHRELGSFLFK